MNEMNKKTVMLTDAELNTVCGGTIFAADTKDGRIYGVAADMSPRPMPIFDTLEEAEAFAEKHGFSTEIVYVGQVDF